MVVSSQLRVLLVEDNIGIANNIADYFTMHDAVIDFAYKGKHGCELAASQYYHCIILDIMLPDIEGLEVCERIRAASDRHIPIIMLTARDTLDDKLAGFTHGADDYLTKPFALEELYVRCLALSNRLNIPQQGKVTSIGDGEKKLTLDYQRQQVSRNNQLLSLPPKVFSILQILIESHPRPVSKSELIDRVWGDNGTDSDSLRSHIYQLRKSVDKPFSTDVVKTIHSVGFALDI
ncbi:response regulator transcription factor [Thalassotalea hakodatensis]|uniref:response regulator transcription factor n=1 Tax=Thalassotalea hakodatensis TaxID=3030492 RepID=UPI002572E22F|nr:response regulator transcription factor [Thalassotalea hakodatensis]